MSKHMLAVLAALALNSLPATAGEELMPMMPSTWSHPDNGQHASRPQVQRITSNDPQPRRASEQTHRQDLRKNVVKLKLPSLGSTRTATQYRVVELAEMDPEGTINFDTANSVPARPQDIPGLLPEALTIDQYNQPVAAPRDNDLRDLISFGEEPDWLYGAGNYRGQQSQLQPTLRRQPPAQLELPPPLTPAAISESQLTMASPFEAPAPAERPPDSTVKLTATPPATAVRFETPVEPAPAPERPAAVVPEIAPVDAAPAQAAPESLRPSSTTDAGIASLKPPPGFTTPTVITPPPAVEKPIPMPEVVARPEVRTAPPVNIVQDNTVDIGQFEDVEGFIPIRSLKVF